jgi:hypothetical protein
MSLLERQADKIAQLLRLLGIGGFDPDGNSYNEQLESIKKQVGIDNFVLAVDELEKQETSISQANDEPDLPTYISTHGPADEDQTDAPISAVNDDPVEPVRVESPTINVSEERTVVRPSYAIADPDGPTDDMPALPIIESNPAPSAEELSYVDRMIDTSDSFAKVEVSDDGQKQIVLTTNSTVDAKEKLDRRLNDLADLGMLFNQDKPDYSREQALLDAETVIKSQYEKENPNWQVETVAAPSVDPINYDPPTVRSIDIKEDTVIEPLIEPSVVEEPASQIELTQAASVGPDAVERVEQFDSSLRDLDVKEEPVAQIIDTPAQPTVVSDIFESSVRLTEKPIDIDPEPQVATSEPPVPPIVTIESAPIIEARPEYPPAVAVRESDVWVQPLPPTLSTGTELDAVYNQKVSDIVAWCGGYNENAKSAIKDYEDSLSRLFNSFGGNPSLRGDSSNGNAGFGTDTQNDWTAGLMGYENTNR